MDPLRFQRPSPASPPPTRLFREGTKPNKFSARNRTTTSIPLSLAKSTTNDKARLSQTTHARTASKKPDDNPDRERRTKRVVSRQRGTTQAYISYPLSADNGSNKAPLGQYPMGDSRSPSPPTTTAATPPVGLVSAGTGIVAGAAAPGSAATTGAAGGEATVRTGDAPAISWAAETAPTARQASRQIPRQPSQRERREREADGQRGGREEQSREDEPNQDSPRPSPASSSATLQPSSSSSATPSRRRSFFSRFSLPFRSPARSFADFHIRPAEPHRKYVAGDHVLGAVVLAVVKPLRITHLTVSLRGIVRVFKDPNTAATAALPPDTVSDTTSSPSRLLAAKAYGSSSSTSSTYLGNGHALLFRDEIVLSGNGLLTPGNYEFQFDLLFPSKGLPSSIDFERGSICYVITANLTRPTTVAPIQSCERKVYLVDPVDISAVPKPRPRTISLEPISKRSKKRKIVVVTQPSPNTGSTTTTSNTSANTPTAAGIPSATSTVSFASGGGSGDQHESVLSERASARDSAHESMQAGGIEQEGSVESQSQNRFFQQQLPRSPAPTDIRSEISIDTVTSGGSGSRSGSGGIGGTAGAGGLVPLPSGVHPAPGSGSGSGSGPGPSSGQVIGAGGGGILRLSSPSGSQAAASTTGNSAGTSATTGTNTSPSTVANPASRSQTLHPTNSVSTATVNGIGDDRTITATIELLKGGCLAGEVVSVKVSVQHVKRIKSLYGVVVTLYRQGRIDSSPPEFMFPSAGTSIAEEDEAEATGNVVGPDSNGAAGGAENAAEHNGEESRQSRKQKKQKQKEEKEREKQLKERSKGHSQRPRSSKGKETAGSGDISSSGSGQANGSTGGRGTTKGTGKNENSLPKSKTSLGGLSLMSAGTCSVFRKDLSQSFSPLIIDPRTMQASVTASVRVPEDSFATIKGVPGEMISFKYQLEVIVDLGGKLASLLQSGVGPAGPNVVSNSSPYDGKPMLSNTPTLWGSGSHMIDTDQLRRQKGVIYVAFEVVVGTTDTSRQRGRGLKAAATASDISQQQSDFQHQQQQQQPSLSHSSTLPPDWYPDDSKDRHQQQQQLIYPNWPANGASASGSGSGSGPSPGYQGIGGPPYSNPQQQPRRRQHPYYQHHHQSEYNNHDYYDDTTSPTAHPYPVYTDRLPPPSAQAPQYVPTDAMLAAGRDTNLSEKDRIRRAEEQLLPSQPGEPSTSNAGQTNGEGASSSSNINNSGRNHGPSAPIVPSLEEAEEFLPSFPGPSAPPDFASAVQASAEVSVDGGEPSQLQQVTEDKQEMERRRLLAEASAPPVFPDDYEDAAAGPSRSDRSGLGGSSRSTRAYSATGTFAAAAGPSEASAPVLEEEDLHQQYQQNHTYHGRAPDHHALQVPSSEQFGGHVEEASAPPAALVGDEDTATATVAASAPTADAVGSSAAVVDPVDGTDEDHYGRHYTYGPGTAADTAHGAGSTEHPEPLPRYER